METGEALSNGLQLTGVQTSLQNLASVLTSIVTPIAIVAFIICGILYIVSSRQGSESVKDWAKRIMVGVAIALAASQIVAFVSSLASGF